MKYIVQFFGSIKTQHIYYKLVSYKWHLKYTNYYFSFYYIFMCIFIWQTDTPAYAFLAFFVASDTICTVSVWL